MGERLAPPVVLDATVLSNFASSDSLDWLIDAVRRPAVAPAVRRELERGRDSGHVFLGAALERLGTDLPVLELEGEDVTDWSAGSVVRDRLDPGEAESLLGALTPDGTLATDDLAARRLAMANGSP